MNEPGSTARDETRADALARQAAAEAASGGLARAAALWRDLIDLAPEDRRGHVGAAEALRLQGACAEADSVLLAAAMWLPEDFEIDLQYAWVAHSAGDREAALRRWERVRLRHPDNPTGPICAALSLRALGRPDLADAMLAPALDRFAGNADVALTYATTAQFHGDPCEAMARWEIVRERHPDHPALAAQDALLAEAGPLQDTPGLRAAERLLQTGQLRAARGVIDGAALTTRVSDDAIWLRGVIDRRLAPAPETRPELLWRSGTQHGWEGDWVRELLGAAGLAGERAFAGEITGPRVVVVDNLLSADKARWYRRLWRRGVRVTLVHLSDEAFGDDVATYRWCHAVLRTYWSPLLARLPQVRFIPPGARDGFAGDWPTRIAAERRQVWSFAGDPGTPARAAMLASMGDVPGGLSQPASTAAGWTIESDRALMQDSLFAPCPSGLANLDSHRVWEALEAGCIPIVERREGFDYFRELTGPHPMPAVSDWREAPALVSAILAQEGGETVRRSCAAWWDATRRRLAREIAAIV